MFGDGAPRRSSATRTVPLRASLIGPLMLGIASVGVMGYLATHQVREVHAADDPIRPHGVKRSRQEIMAFMEAADESKRQGGTPVRLVDVIARAESRLVGK